MLYNFSKTKYSKSLIKGQTETGDLYFNSLWIVQWCKLKIYQKKAYRRRQQNRECAANKRNEYTCEYLILEEDVKEGKKYLEQRLNNLEKIRQETKSLTESITEWEGLREQYLDLMSSDDESIEDVDFDALDKLDCDADEAKQRMRELMQRNISPLISDIESEEEDIDVVNN